MIEELKSLVAQFQQETKSASVLDFITWVGNREALISKMVSQDPRILGRKLADELIKNAGKKSDKK